MSHAPLSAKVKSAAPAAKAKAVSPTLQIAEPDDSLEKEANRMADEIMAAGATGKPQWSLSNIGITTPLHRQAGGSTPEPECPPVVDEVLRSPGQPLEASARSFMEQRIGYDLGRVRIHTGPHAAESARQVNALAYTVGHDVVFGDGQYSPGTPPGQRLLAHELAHVVQQGTAGPGSATPVAKLQRQTGGTHPKITLVDVAQLRRRVKRRGNPDISMLIDAFPDSLRNGASFTLPDTVLNGPNPVQGTNLKFILNFEIKPGKPPLFGDVGGGLGEGTPSTTQAPVTGSPFRSGFTLPQATTTHRVMLFLYEEGLKVPGRRFDPDETLFHELVHLRLLIDKYLPLDRRSATGQKYGRTLIVATEGENIKAPQVLAAPKDVAMGPHRRDVLAKIDALRNWFTSHIPRDKFNPGQVMSNDELLESLVNEKFTNQMANPRINNTTVAENYANSVRDKFKDAADPVAYATAHYAAKQSLAYDDDTFKDQLKYSLLAWYNDIDQATSVPPGTSGLAPQTSVGPFSPRPFRSKN